MAYESARHDRIFMNGYEGLYSATHDHIEDLVATAVGELCLSG